MLLLLCKVVYIVVLYGTYSMWRCIGGGVGANVCGAYHVCAA